MRGGTIGVVSHRTVGLRRRRFLERGISGLYDGLRPARARPIPRAFHSDLCLLAQSCGDLVPSRHVASHTPGDSWQREGPEHKNRALRARLQPSGPVVRLDATPDSISTKIERRRDRIFGTAHWSPCRPRLSQWRKRLQRNGFLPSRYFRKRHPPQMWASACTGLPLVI